jgi:hypothetical protein
MTARSRGPEVRAWFVGYLLFIGLGLAFCVAMAVTHR